MAGRRMLHATAGVVLIAGLGAVAFLPAVPVVTGLLAPALALGTPVLCLAWLLSGLDRAARILVAGVGSIALNAAVAEVMLVCSRWSPRGGLTAVAAVCAVLAVLAAIEFRISGRSPEMPSMGDKNFEDDESWTFDR